MLKRSTRAGKKARPSITPRWRPIRRAAPLVVVTARTAMERLARACEELRLARKRLQKRIGMARSRERERNYSDNPFKLFPVWLPDTISSTFADDVAVPEGADKNTLMLDNRQYRELIGAAISRATIKAAIPKILCGAPRPFDPKRSKIRNVGEKK